MDSGPRWLVLSYTDVVQREHDKVKNNKSEFGHI